MRVPLRVKEILDEATGNIANTSPTRDFFDYFFSRLHATQARKHGWKFLATKSVPGSGEKRDKFASTFYGSNLP